MDRLKAYLAARVPEVNVELGRLLPAVELEPTTLHEAMRYSVMGGGKRIRALLCLLGAESCGGNSDQALSAACAVELVHNYSLVHDDLPAMDDDDMRRGKLTCHKAFGEANAILAGTALLTLAFEILAREYADARGAEAAVCLARAAGHAGMVGGQVLDLEAEGQEPDRKKVELIDRWKTGAMIAAAGEIGGIVAAAPLEKIAALRLYGRALGILFQITDDLLDIEASQEVIGKETGKDAQLKKMTYPAVLGIEAAKELAHAKAAEAKNALRDFDKEALMLRLLADFVLERKS